MGNRPAVACAVALLVAAGAAGASPPRLHPGAVELGLLGSLLSSGATANRASVAVHGTWLRGAAGGLAGLGSEVAYRHVRGLDAVRVSGHLTWQRAIGGTGAYPFAGVWGGAQYERVGSFDQTRFPIGGTAGIRALVSEGAAVRVEYRYARVIDQDLADFNEHEVLTGVTLLLRNRSDGP